MRFEFSTVARILFGAGTLADVGPLAAGMGRRALVVTGRSQARADPLVESLVDHGVACMTFAVAEEPTVDTIRRGVARAREQGCDLVVGFGGGSALDTGKAIAALFTNEGDLMEYLEVVGQGKALTRPPLPSIAIPTTAGTGSEVTRNAVLAVPEQQVKVSLRSPHLLPRLALVDPELTFTLPPALTATTGLDALTQLIEPFVSLRANPLTDALCREGIRRAARSLRRACEQGNDSAAREDMALASLFSGLALANAGLGAVHGFAAAIGGMFPAPHGAVCARLLPLVMAANVRALQEQAPAGEPWERYREVARLLTRSPLASAEDGVRWLQELVEELGIPSLAAYGVRPADLEQIVEKAFVASSMRGNPVPLPAEEMQALLTRALL